MQAWSIFQTYSGSTQGPDVYKSADLKKKYNN